MCGGGVKADVTYRWLGRWGRNGGQVSYSEILPCGNEGRVRALCVRIVKSHYFVITLVSFFLSVRRYVEFFLIQALVLCLTVEKFTKMYIDKYMCIEDERYVYSCYLKCSV